MIRNFIANGLLSFLPPTRLFKLKEIVLNVLGFKISSGAKITGAIKFYGRGKISIGSNSWIGIGCKFYVDDGYEVFIGEQCDVAPDVVFHTGSHQQGSFTRRAGIGFSDSIEVGSGSWIGIRSTILAGAIFKPGTIIAAGAIVRTGNYNGNTLLAGVPAREKKKFEHEN